MCGITGYLNLNEEPIRDTSSILSMLKVQKHRGPDDSGIRAFSLHSPQSKEFQTSRPQSVDGNFEGMLGFNRLSILDLSEKGHQPMLSPDDKVVLTLNGEIYNAFDFKPELEKWGYNFQSTSDTEIVLALYLRYGIDGLVKRLNGMFAIVIVDLRLQGLFIIRDRFGIKPMYYIHNSEKLAFSSELKSFKYLDGFKYQLNEDQLDEFLLFRNNLKGTLFRDIESLEPGHYLMFSKGSLVKRRFFNVDDYSRTANVPRSLESFGQRLEDSLGKSVQSQLMSDVKLGCQLSGGVDSSLVTWLANRNSAKGSFESVSVIFNNQQFNEEKYIDQVAQDLSIQSHKFLLNSDYYIDNLENATWHLEAPINHPNTIGIYKLSQRAKDYVTVLLSGEGADEVFGGYGRFYELSYPYKSKLLLHQLKMGLKYPKDITDYFSSENRAVMATSFMTSSLARDIWSGFSKEKATRDRKALYNSCNGSLFDRQVKYEIQTYLPDLLIRQDKMSMAHSIENRVPFLDNNVVEGSFSIPEKFLMLRNSPEGNNTEKYLMKKLAARTFGNDFAFRDKMGFGIPIREFFQNKRFTEYLNDKTLPGIKSRGMFDHKLISTWLLDIQNLSYNNLEALWVVVSFEIWASIYLNGNYENRNSF